MLRTLTAMTLAIAIATPAVAGNVYKCKGKSTMTFVDETGEMIIRRPGKADVSIPWGGAAGRHAWWSADIDAEDCSKAPCAEDWVPAHQPRQLFYMLDEGVKVMCKPEGE